MLTTRQRWDVIVVGLGAFGMASLMQLAKAGGRVLGLDRGEPPHTLGSSHGETRITRVSIGEGAAYLPLVRRSHEIWPWLEAETGLSCFTKTGGLFLDSGDHWGKKGGEGSEGFVKKTIALAEASSIPHEILTAAEIRSRFPGFEVSDRAFGYYEPDSGFVRPEAAIRAQRLLALRFGAEIRDHQDVTHLEKAAHGGVAIYTAKERLEAEKVLVTAGAWLHDFLPTPLHPTFRIRRQVLHWLPVEPHAFPLGRSPIFLWGFGKSPEDFLYGFPSLDGQTIKVASENYTTETTPKTVERDVTDQEQEDFFQTKIQGRLRSILGKPRRSVVCLYTLTDDSNFWLREHPEIPKVVVASFCSGHGFKHSAACGEAFATYLGFGSSSLDLRPFQRPWE